MPMENINKLIDSAISAVCGAPEELDTQPFDLNELRHCIMMELIKDAYYESEPKASLRSYVDATSKDSDDIRMRNSRLLKYAQYYRTQQYNSIADNYGIEVPELLPDDMEAIEKKLEGHKLTRMQFFELQQMADIPVLKAIKNKRICSTKKITNEQFRKWMADYDAFVQTLVDKLDKDEDTLFSTIALYTLEWKYDIELFYACAVEAEKYPYDESTVQKVFFLCGQLGILIPPTFTRRLQTESRFIKNRLSLVPYIFDGSDWNPIDGKIQAYLLLKYAVKKCYEFEGRSILQIILETTTPDDWTNYIKENYDLRPIYVKKKWTNKRIRYARILFDKLQQDIEPPKL